MLLSELYEKCLTPGAIYHFEIKDGKVAATVKHKKISTKTKKQAINLENQLHDALEQVLAKFFEKPKK